MIEKTSFENYHKSMEKLNDKFKNGKYKSYLETFKSKFLKKISCKKFDDKIVLNSYANATKSAIKLKDELNSILILNLYKRSVLLNNDFSENISFKEIFDVKNDNDEKIKKIRLDIQILFDDNINLDILDKSDIERDEYMKYKLSKNKLFFASEMKKAKIKDEDILLLFDVKKKVLNGIFSNNFRRIFATVFDLLILLLKVGIIFFIFLHFFGISKYPEPKKSEYILKENLRTGEKYLVKPTIEFSQVWERINKVELNRKHKNNHFKFISLVFISVLFLIAWLHFAMPESGKQRRTVGKRIMGLRVVGINGEKISFAKASLRYFVKFFGFFIFAYLLALITRRSRTLHDMISGTLVAKDKYLPVVRKGPKPRGSSRGGSGGDSGISIDIE